MLKIKLAENSEGRWFEFMEGVSIKVRPLSGSVLKELRKSSSTVKMELNGRTRRREPVEILDEERLEENLIDYLIEDFKGIGDQAGNPLEVTESSKRLIANNLTLRDFVWSSAQSLDIGADLEKN